MKSLISVVVPIYNGEKYLNRVFDCVKSQTIKPFEVILVDDGSTDNTPEICDRLCNEYSWVKTVHKSNGGLSSARNAGIQHAEGTHIMFVDVDDYIDNGAVESISQVLDTYNPDIVDFGMVYVNQNGIESRFHNKLPKNKILEYSDIHQMIIPELIHVKKRTDYYVYEYSVNKVYKAEMLRSFDITFDETRRVWEDLPFVVKYLKYCNTYYSMAQHLYYYCFTSGSLGQKFYPQQFEIVLKNNRDYRNWYGNEYDFDNQISIDYWASAIENVIHMALNNNDTDCVRNSINDVLKSETVRNWLLNKSDINLADKLKKRAITQSNAKLYIYMVQIEIALSKIKDNASSLVNRTIRKLNAIRH